MAKTKRKTHSEVEASRGIIRELEKEVRSLRQQLRQYEKYEQRSQDIEYSNDNEDTHVELKLTMDCDSCGKGKMIETLELGGKIYGTCNVCDHRGRMR